MPVQIITRRVISQALSWANVPPILHAEYSPQTINSPDFTACQQVWLSFDRYALHQWLRQTEYFEGYPRTDAIVSALRDCFCPDIQVMSAQYGPCGTAQIRVSLLLIVAQGAQ